MMQRRSTGVLTGFNALILTAIFTLSPSPSRADETIVSSLALKQGGVTHIYGVGHAEAQSFLTGSFRYQLTSIIARVGNRVGNQTTEIKPFANLRADDGNNGPVTGKTNYLTAFAVPTISTTGLLNETFLPNAPVILEANTRYWFALGSLGGSDNDNFEYQWVYSSSGGPLNIPSRYALTNDEGEHWTLARDNPYLFEVRGERLISAAPEPSTLAFLGLTLGVLAASSSVNFSLCRNPVRKKK
jgi:hypothetical protein